MLRVLKEPRLLDGIPSYVNSRPVAMNIQLIETAIWLAVTKIMAPSDIHKALVACETKGKALQRNILPLLEDVLADAMLANNRVLPRSLYLYWCKKCFNFLECSKFLRADKKKATNAPQKSQGGAGAHNSA